MTSKTPSKGYVEAWDVESKTEPGKVYTVSKRADGAFACSCAAWKFHRAPKVDCKHIDAVRCDTNRPAFGYVDLTTKPPVDLSVEKRQPDLSQFRRKIPTLAAVIERAKEPDALERFTVRRKFKLTE